MRVENCMPIIALVLAAAAIGSADDRPSLEVRFLTPHAEGAPAIGFAGRQTFELKNVTDHELKLWHPDSRAGSEQFSLQFKNLRTGEVTVARQGPYPYDGDVDRFETITIPPGRTFRWTTEFRELWHGFPTPSYGENHSITVRFESPNRNKAVEHKVWIGRVESRPTTIRLVLWPESPEAYVWAGFPERAIELMEAHPELVSAAPLETAVRFDSGRVIPWLFEHGLSATESFQEHKLYFYSADSTRQFMECWPQLANKPSGMGTLLLEVAQRFVSEENAERRKRWREAVDAALAAGADYDLLTAITLDDLARVKEIVKTSPQLADRFVTNQHWYGGGHQMVGATFALDQTRSFQPEKEHTISPLRYAARYGRLEICRYLIDQHHVNINDTERDGGVPIMKDALAHPAVVRMLIARGADVQTRFVVNLLGNPGMALPSWRGDNATLLHIAVQDGKPETVKLLIDAGVDAMAATNRNARLVIEDGEVVEKPADNSVEETALDIASELGRAEHARAILDSERFRAFDPQTRKKHLDRCLVAACSSVFHGIYDADYAKLVELLLERGADPNATRAGHTAIQYAVQSIMLAGSPVRSKKIIACLQKLRDAGARVDLCSAVVMNDESLVQQLIQADPQSAKAVSIEGTPALHLAVLLNHVNIVKELLRAGCDVDIGDRGSQTALAVASYENRLDIAEVLLASSANVNAKREGGWTALHGAVQEGHVEMARLLLEHGADVNSKVGKDQMDLLDFLKQFITMSRPVSEEMQNIIEEYRRQ